MTLVVYSSCIRVVPEDSIETNNLRVHIRSLLSGKVRLVFNNVEILLGIRSQCYVGTFCFWSIATVFSCFSFKCFSFLALRLAPCIIL
jgi:hypothetical protein